MCIRDRYFNDPFTELLSKPFTDTVMAAAADNGKVDRVYEGNAMYKRGPIRFRRAVGGEKCNFLFILQI